MQSRHRMPETNQCRRSVFVSWNCATRHPERCARMEKTKQETNEAHSLYGQHHAERRLKFHNCFLRSVKPAEFSPKIIRCNEWLRRLQTRSHKVTVNLSESLARGYDSPWTTWRCLNRLRTGFTCSREQRQKWGYFEGDTTCECGLATENTAHMMQHTLLHCPAHWMTSTVSTI